MNERAEELGVKIIPFKNNIDVFDWNGNFICTRHWGHSMTQCSPDISED